MINLVAEQKVLDVLKTIGLNLYERKLWVSLLSRGTSTAGELSNLAKVPHSRTYDVLESLADKGFVMIQPTKPLKYVAIQPNEALDRAQNRLHEKTEVSVTRIKRLQKSSVAKDLEKIFKTGVTLVEPGEFVGSLKGRHAFHQQLDTVFKNAKKKVSIVTTPAGLDELHSKHGETLRKAASKGVKIRIAVPSLKSDTVGAVKKYADVRKTERHAGRLCLVDDTHLVMSFTDDKSVHPTQDFGLWTQSNHVAGDVVGYLFENLWDGLKSA